MAALESGRSQAGWWVRWAGGCMGARDSGVWEALHGRHGWGAGGTRLEDAGVRPLAASQKEVSASGVSGWVDGLYGLYSGLFLSFK